MRYLIEFSYDGTKFHGFQRQKDVKNVQSLLENNLSLYFSKNILIKGSGRTDAGVHALGQCAHFDYEDIIIKRDIKNINTLLNDDIKIKKCHLVADSFHARYSVKNKTYYYLINNGKHKEKYEGYYYQIKRKLNYNKMKDASELFIGTHDFRNFVSGYRDDYISTIYSISFKKRRDLIKITFVGKGFYRYMVRHLVGALVDVGKDKISKDVIREMLEKTDEFKSLSVAPADGLYLKKINYEKKDKFTKNI